MGFSWGEGTFLSMSSTLFLEFDLFWVWTFLQVPSFPWVHTFSWVQWVWQSLWVPRNSLNPWVPRSLLGDWMYNPSSDGEKNCIVCRLFCIFFIIIIITIIVIILIVVLLNCLYVNPQVSLFVHSPPDPTGGRSEWAAAWSLLPAAGLNHDRLPHARQTAWDRHCWRRELQERTCMPGPRVLSGKSLMWSVFLPAPEWHPPVRHGDRHPPSSAKPVCQGHCISPHLAWCSGSGQDFAMSLAPVLTEGWDSFHLTVNLYRWEVYSWNSHPRAALGMRCRETSLSKVRFTSP